MDDEASELAALEHIMSDASAEPIKLSYGLLRSITDNFSNEIGRGGFGIVYQGVLRNGDVAVKKLLNLHALPEKKFLEEIMCLKKAKHKNIVRFLGYCSETQGELLEFNGKIVLGEAQQKLLCFEYVPNGNIKHYLQQDKSQGDDWPLRYQMIRGICQGLHFLHGELINHLDLKPENIMLDAQMEPKITDFGLSRCLDQGHSIITQNILGTMRYIAPETIDKGEISFKSDMYALGIIIIELLTGIDKIDLDNLDEYLDKIDCPRASKCVEIALNCKDLDKQNRPTIHEVTCDLSDLEKMIPWSSIEQVAPTAFPGTELVDFYPLELRFPFVPYQKMYCEISLTNKHTDAGVWFMIIPEVPNRYQGRLSGFMSPMYTIAIPLSREAEMYPPLDVEKFQVLMFITGTDVDVVNQQISTLCFDEGATIEDEIKVTQEMLGFELHRVMLTAVFEISEENDRALVVNDIRFGEEVTKSIISIDVHPREPWVLITEDGNRIHIWNWMTNEKMEIVLGKPRSYLEGGGKVGCGVVVAKFITRKSWVVMGFPNGLIDVRMYPTMDRVKEFRAHREGVTSLAVHSTRPLLLTCGYPLLMMLWDWNYNWNCIGIFNIAEPVRQVMFDPKHSSNFATLDTDGAVKVWRIGDPDPIAKTRGVEDYETSQLFTYAGDRHFIAAIDGQAALVRAWHTKLNIIILMCMHTSMHMRS
uniref:Uncharacterized protein n=1 Tax=Avena sativa TaxID=4498 RepID=A0ACD5V9J0_AVESA